MAAAAKLPNIGLIAAIGGAADKVVIDGGYRISQLEQSSKQIGGLRRSQQRELATTRVTEQVNRELGDVARAALQAIEARFNLREAAYFQTNYKPAK